MKQIDLTRNFLTDLGTLLGPKGLRLEERDIDPHLSDWRGLYRGKALALALPASTAEVAGVVGLCARHRVPIVPQGGNTGLSGAATPDADGRALIVNLQSMNRVRALDPANNSMIVEAGAILADIQAAAASIERLFPLSLSAEGSCQIGGNLSTNAGGINVLKFGNARDLVLGLEVVLASGEVLDDLKSLRKDNSGYDLKQLFIGAEGTLGIITAASLKLFPAFRRRATSLAALTNLDRAPALLARCQTMTGGQIVSFELLPYFGRDLACRHFGLPQPLPNHAAWQILIEAASPAADFDLKAALQSALAEALEAGAISDAIMAESETKRQSLWRLREAMVESQKREGASIKHDISVPVAAIASFVAEAGAALANFDPALRLLCFGHFGDGNLHFNILQPAGTDPAAFLARTDSINHLVHDIVLAHKGSFSAEHGIGQLRRAELLRLKSPVALDLMRRIKQTLDPENLMNPGKIL